MNTSLYVDNIKCGGCANRIQNKLNDIVTNVAVDESQGNVQFDFDNNEQLEKAKDALASMGYVSEGQSNLGDKAKSYVSCMIGRVT